MTNNLTTLNHLSMKQQAHEARLIRAAQDLALEKAKLRLAIQQVDERRAERETTKTENNHA